MKWTCKNPLVKPSFKQWFMEWFCSKVGHKTIGDYYRMPQAHCSRCGSINKGIASEGCSEWILPD